MNSYNPFQDFSGGNNSVQRTSSMKSQDSLCYCVHCQTHEVINNQVNEGHMKLLRYTQSSLCKLGMEQREFVVEGKELYSKRSRIMDVDLLLGNYSDLCKSFSFSGCLFRYWQNLGLWFSIEILLALIMLDYKSNMYFFIT